MWRRIALALGLLVSMVVLLPLATSTAHNLRFQLTARSSHHYHHHSRAWWRRHRAKQRRRQAIIARRRAMSLEARNGVRPNAAEKSSDNHASTPSLALPTGLYQDGNFSMPLPNGWSADSPTKGTTSFRIASSDASPTQATLAVVAVAPGSSAPAPIGREQRNNLAGLSYSELRRTVIDRMVSAGGWVVNDRQREIGGHRVFEVIAQTPSSSDGKPEQIWNFYFTEVNGRIYSLTTHAASTHTQKLSADAETFLTTFRPVDGKGLK